MSPAPALPLPAPLVPAGSTFTLSLLWQERASQQNKFTSAAIRKGAQAALSAKLDASYAQQDLKPERTLKDQLLHRFQELVDTASPRSGYKRLQRWFGTSAADQADAATLTKARAKLAEVRRTAGTKYCSLISYRITRNCGRGFYRLLVQFIRGSPLATSRHTAHSI